jgi:hypothetical protein
MSDLDDLVTDPNGPAYERTEERTGPPLDYVAEKLGHCLHALHGQHRAVAQLPADLPTPGKAAGKPQPLKESLLSPGRYAFHYGVVAFLALHNILALANDHGLEDRLLGMSDEEFEAWMERIREEGSVTG